jgi:hypothetical protein
MNSATACDTYATVHVWLRRFKKAGRCEQCNAEGYTEWAWLGEPGGFAKLHDMYTELCIPCHDKRDGRKERRQYMASPTATGHGTQHSVGIGTLAARIDRRPATIRMWEREGYLPKHLRGARDARRWRWWTEAQATEIEEWARNRYPGSSLPGYHPTPEEQRATIDAMRVPRSHQAAA